MTNQEILTKAISQAIEGGYTPDGITDVTNFRPTIRNGQTWVRWFNDNGQEVIQDLEHVIYNHDFAKALWGSETTDLDTYRLMEQPRDIYPWKYHLMQMVIANDPIKYLGENI